MGVSDHLSGLAPRKETRFGDTEAELLVAEWIPQVSEMTFVNREGSGRYEYLSPEGRAARFTRPIHGNPSFVFELRDSHGNTARSSATVPSEGSPGQSRFWFLFFPALTAMVGFWATVALNIPDFMRFAKSQRAQFMGQMIGLPPTMVLFSFIGIFVTCAAVVVFPDILIKEQAPWDPVQLLKRKEFASPVIVALSTLFLLVATLSTNIAANVVAPANAITNLFPKSVSFKAAGVITGVIGIVMMPWKLIADPSAYIFKWLIGYSALLGPIGGIMIADYFIVRRQRLNVPHLYKIDGEYTYSAGIHWRGIAVLILSILPNVPGFLATAGFVPASSVPAIFLEIYTYAWFTGFGLALVLYSLVARRPSSASGR
ncbi:MAG: cytosine permease [Planctomycetes bacterium]|nr:cytosine permease [Planctomycetota bacterium]